jgi:hypothetical protein
MGGIPNYFLFQIYESWVPKVLCLLLDKNIDLVLIDQQSVGKRSLHLMDTDKAKKRWTAINILAFY